MAISAPTKSLQYANRTATPPVYNDGQDNGPLFIKYAALTFTAAGFTTAALGDLKLQRMPAGKVRIYLALCRIVCPIGTATSDLDLGIGAYVKADGTLQALQGALLADSLDVGGAAIDADLNVGVVDVIEVVSKSGFDLVASFDTANSPAAGVLRATIAYTHDAQGA